MKKTKAFTLIELLVVIAIIGILATVVAVNFTGAQKKARYSAAISNLNESLKVAQACPNDEGNLTVLNNATNPTLPICNGATISANWPTINGYDYTVTSSASIVSVVTVTPKNGTDTGIICTAVGTPAQVLSCK